MPFTLNFHGIGEPGRPYETGEEPYWITRERFEEFLDLAQAGAGPVAITFDDGNDSDYRIAAPILRERGLSAEFFVLAGKLNQPGYLTREQVKELDADPLFSIGSHGMNHRPWPDIDDTELESEVREAKEILERVCERPMRVAGLPFGRYDARTMKRLAANGFTTIYSSDGMPRLSGANPIPRFSVRNDTPLSAVADMIASQNSFFKRARGEAAARIKVRR